MVKTVLVTGAAGFIGSHLCDRLLGDGFEVIGIDNMITGSLDNLQQAKKNPRFHFEVHDVREPFYIYTDVIFNLACPASPAHYQKNPIDTFTTSVIGVHQLIKNTQHRKCTIIHTSTSEVYGDPDIHPQHEGYWGNVNPVGPRGVYDEAKRFQEAMTMAYHTYHGLETRIVRIFNTYGPRMRLNDGRVLPAFIGQALRGEDLTMFGDGSQTRSFCYVSDLVEGIYRLLLSDYAHPVNIGNPDEITIKEFGEEIIKLTNTTQKLISKPLPTDDPKQRKPDITLARKILGWEPKVSREEGLKITYEYFKTLTPEELQNTAYHRFN